MLLKMGNMVCNGAMCQCSFGAAPSTLLVLPNSKVVLSNMPAAVIMDNKPMVNVVSFGMCTSPSNPAVAAAAGAPQPCTPACMASWVPGCPTVLIGGKPILNNSSKLMCTYGGVISVTNPGQATVQSP